MKLLGIQMSATCRAAVALLGLMIASPAPGAEWLDIAGANAPLFPRVEVDIASPEFTEMGQHLAVQVTRSRPLLHRSGVAYRSFIAVVRLDCDSRRLTPIAVTFYSLPRGRGEPVSSETDLSGDGVTPELLDIVPVRARKALLRVACMDRT